MKGLPFHEIWAMFLADQKREKDIRDALDATSTEDLTKMWDDLGLLRQHVYWESSCIRYA